MRTKKTKYCPFLKKTEYSYNSVYGTSRVAYTKTEEHFSTICLEDDCMAYQGGNCKLCETNRRVKREQ